MTTYIFTSKHEQTCVSLLDYYFLPSRCTLFANKSLRKKTIGNNNFKCKVTSASHHDNRADFYFQPVAVLCAQKIVMMIRFSDFKRFWLAELSPSSIA